MFVSQWKFQESSFSQSMRLGVSVGFQQTLESKEVGSDTSERMNLPKASANRQRARDPFFRLLHMGFRHKGWPKLEVGLLTWNEPIKKNPSQVCPDAQSLVNSRYSQFEDQEQPVSYCTQIFTIFKNFHLLTWRHSRHCGKHNSW